MSDTGYQVLARKWRPQRFADVVGQSAVVRTLENALRSGRIAHAYCFSGIRGVGKTTAARLLAKGLNCHEADGPTAEPCGRCDSCREIESSRSLDVIELDAASHTGVDDIRELNEVARYAPSRDRYRVFIIDEAHMLSKSANNALLKTIEEPPAWLVFVLATTEPSKIEATVLSRCQLYEFGRISQGELRRQLGRIATAEGVTISDDALALLSEAASGSLRDGQSLLDKLIAFAGNAIDEKTVIELLGLVDRILVHRAVDLVAAEDVAGVLAFVNEMVERGVDLHQFTVDLLGHFRNLLVARSVPDAGTILHLPADDLEHLRRQAEAFDMDDLDRAFSLLAASEYRIKLADQPRYHVEVLLARLARMPRLTPISELLQALESGSGSGSGSGSSHGGSGSGRARSVAPAQPTRAPRVKAAPAPPAVMATATPSADTRPVPSAPTPAPAAPEPSPKVVEESPPHEDIEAPAFASRLLARIRQEMETRNPMNATVLARACGLTLAGERVVLQFPASARIFVQRLQEPAMLGILGEATSTVLGRRAVVRVEVLAGTAAPPPLAMAEQPESPAARVEVVRDSSGPGATSPATGEAVPTGARALVEEHPLVQEFVKALKGQIVSVEEL